MIEIALDALQKLITYRYLDGKSIFDGRSLMEVLIETVCANFNQHQEEGIQLQILKVLFGRKGKWIVFFLLFFSGNDFELRHDDKTKP